MLDEQGRLAMQKELVERSSLKFSSKIIFYYDSDNKRLLLENEETDCGYYFIRSFSMDSKGRVCIPKAIRDAFPNARYLPTEKDGKIYILIID